MLPAFGYFSPLNTQPVVPKSYQSNVEGIHMCNNRKPENPTLL